jgi:dGTPase
MQFERILDSDRPQDFGLAVYACLPSQSRGRLIAEPESATRTVYQRDRDRIIHAGAFRKLKYKTQVFFYHEGDYYRTRLTHSIEVAQIARSVSRVLGLNEDLAEALALAHDLGHTCFGHAGEIALNDCMADYGGFDHNDQALRIVTSLEKRYAEFDGLNLSWETLEGLVKHNGPLLPEKPGKKLGLSIAAYNANSDLWLASHASAEAQVAALADDIAYNNHDLDDGLRAGMFRLEELDHIPLVSEALNEIRSRYPGLETSRLIAEMVRRLINAMVSDLLGETRQRFAALNPLHADDIRYAAKPVVAFSTAMQERSLVLRDFLHTNMYRHYRVERMFSRAKRVVHDLFEMFLREPQCLPTDWQIASGDKNAQARLIADYIAGMTDRYAFAEHQRLFDLDAPPR